jgi:peptide/nickel transport system permease protein
MRFLWDRFLQGLAVAFGLISILFFLFKVLPGDPARMMMGQREDSEQLAKIYERYGLDLPIWKQYLFYINDLSPVSLHSDEGFTAFSEEKFSGFLVYKGESLSLALKMPYLRESFQKGNRKIGSILAQVLPNTLLLALCAMSLALLLGIGMGMLAAMFPNSKLDKALVLFSSMGMALPSFFSAILIAWIFGFILHEYTGLEMNGNLFELDDLGEKTQLKLKNLILPAFTLGIRPLGVITQLTRSSLLEVLELDYIRTARSKGLTEWNIVRKHAMPNAIIPVVTAASGWFSSMLAGSVFVEYIFGWNGLGKQVVEALQLLDLPLVMGAVLVIGMLFVLVNIGVDILYRILDPRLRNQ